MAATGTWCMQPNLKRQRATQMKSVAMAFSPSSAHSASLSPLLKQHSICTHRLLHYFSLTNQRNKSIINHRHLVCSAKSPPEPLPQQNAPSVEDTRIHWENDEDGWIGGGGGGGASSNRSQSTQEQLNDEDDSFLGNKFSELLNTSVDSHYQFLGISAEADVEEIKAAYRRLSKEYHPDTTSLPIKAASEKFMKLKEIYDVLSDEEKRKFYDWTLAQEVASREAEKLRRKFEDPHMREVQDWVPIPDVVDRLGGRNMELSDQAKSALTFDILAIIFSAGCIIYALFFKEY